MLYIFQQSFHSRNYRYSGLDHCFLGSDLVAHGTDLVRSGADEFDSVFAADFCKLAVLCQKSIARMNTICIGDFGCRHDVGDVQITVGTGRFSDTHSFICESYVQAILVGSRINSYSFNAHFTAGSDYPESDFTSVGDQYFFEHDSWIS